MNKSNRYFFLTITAAAFIAFPLFGYCLIQDSGFLTIVDDFNNQQIPFSLAAWEGIRSGAEWIWSVDLGSSLITAFGFYNLGSPFFWLYLVLPKESFPLVAGLLYPLKYVTAAAAAFCYIRRFTKDRAAVIGALLYAFSGFQSTNLEFYHFHDVVAFFPLLLWGVELLLEEQDPVLFVFSVFLNSLVNYFFFVQEIVFLILYVITRVFRRENILKCIKVLLQFLICGLLGTGMASFLFLPNAVYLLGNQRAAVKWFLEDFFYAPQNLLFILKGILLPGDAMNASSAIIQQNWLSASCYLPLFGIGGTLAFIMKKKKSPLKALLILLLVCCCFRITNALFLLFTAEYQRWWYMLTMIMALSTAKMLDAPDEYPIRKAAVISAFLTIFFCLLVSQVSWNASTLPLVFIPNHFCLLALIALAGYCFLWILPGFRKKIFPILLSLVSIFCMLTTGLTLHFYRASSPPGNAHSVRELYFLSSLLPDMDDQYRYDLTENLLLLPYNTAGIGSFISTAENASYDFLRLFDLDTHIWLGSKTNIPYVAELVGGKYQLSESVPSKAALKKIQTADSSFYISEKDACPIGFALDHYISRSSLVALPAELRAITLMNAFVMEDETVTALSSAVSAVNCEDIDYENPSLNIQRTVDNSVMDFSRDGHGFSCKTDWDSDRVVYFSVPYDTGWTALVDNEKNDIIYSGGMMALTVPAGAHTLRFEYRTPGFRTGILVSILSFFLFFSLFLLHRKKAQKIIMRSRQGYSLPTEK